MAALRLFTCECGHKLRFGAEKCGKCYHRTPFANRVPVWLAGSALLVLILLGVVMRV